MKMGLLPRQVTILSIILLITVRINITAQNDIDPSKALPQNINGWTASVSDRVFDSETLYDYIDGGAELFMSFGFSKVFNRIYTCDKHPDIIVDVFYMNTSYDAYGVFSFSMGKIENEFGQQSQRLKGAILFWKNNFYVSVMSSPETEESKDAISEIARLIDQSIPSNGPLPEVLNYLPERSLNKESIRYFRHYIWLNSHCFISNENILNVDQNTQGVLAKYGEGEWKTVLLLIEYLNSVEAGAARDKFVKNYNQKLENNPILQLDNNGWMGIELIGNFFVGVFNGSNEESVKNFIGLVKETIIKK